VWVCATEGVVGAGCASANGGAAREVAVVTGGWVGGWAKAGERVVGGEWWRLLYLPVRTICCAWISSLLNGAVKHDANVSFPVL
jgi:hypothetical protein